MVNTTIINAGGKGTRRYPDTQYKPKVMLDYEGKPILDYILDRVAGISESILITINKPLGLQIADHILENHANLPVTFVPDDVQAGDGYGVYLCSHFVGHDDGDVLVCNDDTIFDFDPEVLQDDNILFVSDTYEPFKYGVVDIEDGMVVGIAEKPAIPYPNLRTVMTSPFYFKSMQSLFRSLHALLHNQNVMLTECLQTMLKRNKFKAVELNEWQDLGS